MGPLPVRGRTDVEDVAPAQPPDVRRAVAVVRVQAQARRAADARHAGDQQQRPGPLLRGPQGQGWFEILCSERAWPISNTLLLYNVLQVERLQVKRLKTGKAKSEPKRLQDWKDRKDEKQAL
jgi:hypothetical protein